MGRASEISDGNAPIDRTVYNPLVQDYVSQTDTSAQTIASCTSMAKRKLIPKAEVWKAGSTYYAIDEDGASISEGSDASVVVQAAFDDLTGGRDWIEKVALKGSFTLNKQSGETYALAVPAYTELDLRQARLTLANTQNCNMIENASYGSSHADLHINVNGGILKGNKANNTSGSCFKGAFRRAIFRDVWIEDFKEYGIYLSGFSGENVTTKMWGVYSIGNDKSGLYINVYADDQYLTGCNFGNNASTQMFSKATNLQVIGCHFFGAVTGALNGLHIDWAKHFRVIGCEFENINRHGLALYPATGGCVVNRGTITGNTFWNIGKETDNTYYGILLNAYNADVKYNRIIGNTLYSDVANKYKYGIYGVNANCDWNRVNLNYVEAGSTGTVDFSGAGVNNNTDNND